jgi:hypothetical protein
MALPLPINRGVDVTAAKSYTLVLGVCNTSFTGSFSAIAVPTLKQGTSLVCFRDQSDQNTTFITLTPGMQSQAIVSSRKPAGSDLEYPVLALRPQEAMSVSVSGTAVSVTIPFGVGFVKNTTGTELTLANAPERYRYSVFYGSLTNRIATGIIDINIKTASPPPGSEEFSVCSVKVT